MDDIRKDLLSADMSEVAIEDLLQVLSLKSLAKLEGWPLQHLLH